MKKNIWIMNHYAGGMFFEHGGRHYNFAKYLKRQDYEPVVFCCNSKHNSQAERYFDEESLWHEHMAEEIGTPFVFVKARTYVGNGKQRIMNMIDFYRNVKKTAKEYAKLHGKPDVIYASSVHPLTLVAGIQLAKQFGVKCVCEIRDLWPESIVAYGIAGPHNPAVLFLRRLEKWMYKKADAIVFTMEGAYDYIIERGWEKDIPRAKVHYINNGVDLEVFDYNKEHYKVDDSDLEDSDTFKVVYTGSLRKANDQIYALFDTISQMQGPEYEDYRFFIYGKGELIPELEDLCRKNGYRNVKLKGFVEKKYVPYILSKCDVNILNCKANAILKYGGSQNKLFEYLASGHPIISGEGGSYSVIRSTGCGVSEEFTTAEEFAFAIRQLREKKIPYVHIRAVAEEYDFRNLTNRLIRIIEGE